MKFRPEPWASAFVSAAGSVSIAEEAMENLRVFCLAALALPGDISGRTDADRLGRCIAAALARISGRETAEKTPKSAENAAGFASRFIQLMIREHCFYQYGAILREIEKAIYRQKGIEEVIVETAEEPGSGLLGMVKEKAPLLTGARDVKLVSRVIPDLIGGMRLRWGGIVLDGSVKRRLEKMAVDMDSCSG